MYNKRLIHSCESLKQEQTTETQHIIKLENENPQLCGTDRETGKQSQGQLRKFRSDPGPVAWVRGEQNGLEGEAQMSANMRKNCLPSFVIRT